MKLYRCTRDWPYQANCAGRSDVRARQGYYIEAVSANDARATLAEEFPDDGKAGYGMTADLWEDEIPEEKEEEKPAGETRMRYSGEIKVKVVLTARDQYVCQVTDDNGDEYIQVVEPPAILTDAIDSDEAFDRAARAAISFVAAEAEERGEHGTCEACAYTDDELWISSDPECRWPEPEETEMKIEQTTTTQDSPTFRQYALLHRDVLLQNIAGALHGMMYTRVSDMQVEFHQDGEVVWKGGLAQALDVLANDLHWDENNDWSKAERATVEVM
jgi:hypothetical protein